MPGRAVSDIPQGLTVRRDGAWLVGDAQVVHPESLRRLKSHLVFEDEGAFVVDGGQRMPVAVHGPAWSVVALVLDVTAERAHVVLDDGSQEAVAEASLRMHEDTGRFECLVRGGRAVLSRGAHQTLLEHAEEEGGRFFLRVGSTRLPIRT